MVKKKKQSKEENQKWESREAQCAKVVRNSRFWQMVGILSVTNFFAFTFLRDLSHNSDLLGQWLSLPTYFFSIIFFITTFIIYDLPLQINSLTKLKRSSFFGLIIILSWWVVILFLSNSSPNLLIYLIWLFFVF